MPSEKPTETNMVYFNSGGSGGPMGMFAYDTELIITSPAANIKIIKKNNNSDDWLEQSDNWIDRLKLNNEGWSELATHLTKIASRIRDLQKI